MGGRGSSGGNNPNSNKPAPMTREERIDAMGGEYRYHTTTARALPGIYSEGLKPSTRGYAGKGVYFSVTEEQSLGWMESTTGGDKVLRVKTSYLRNKTNYDEIDNEQGLTTRKIPSKYIEIKNASGKWESLESYAKRYWRSFGISRS